MQIFMKKCMYILLLFSCVSKIYSRSYLDSLDSVIHEKMKLVHEQDFQEAEKLIGQIQKITDKKLSLKDLEALIQNQQLKTLFSGQLMLADQHNLDDQLAHQASTQELEFLVSVKIYLAYLDACHQQMLAQAEAYYALLGHWKNEKFHDTDYFYKKNITSWFASAAYSKKIKDNIEQLTAMSQQIYSVLGLMKHNQHLLEQAQTCAELQDRFTQAIQAQDELLSIPCTNDPGHGVHAALQASMQQVLSLNAKVSDVYAESKSLSYKLQKIQKYSGLAVLMSLCAVAGCIYQDQIVQGATHFWSHHMQQPVQSNIAFFTGKVVKETTFNIADTEAVIRACEETIAQGSEPSTSIMNGAFSSTKEMMGWGPSASNSSGQEDLTAIADRRCPIILANLGSNLNKVHTAMIRHVEKEVLSAKKLINTLVPHLDMLLELQKLIPLGAILTASVLAYKKFYTSYVYLPMRKIVRELDILCNETLYTKYSFNTHGRLLFLTNQLKRNMTSLPIEQQQCITQDIADLESFDLDNKQKFNVIQRMYHHYTDLFPRTV